METFKPQLIMQKLLFIVLGLLFTSVIVITVFSERVCDIWVSLQSSEQKSSIVIPREIVWKSSEISLDSNYNLSRLYVVDQNLIFGIKYHDSGFTVFRSSDFGKHWDDRGKLTDLNLRKMMFQNLNKGILAVSKTKPSSDFTENDGLLLKTDDGGTTWTVVCESPHTTIYDINVMSSGIGVAVGRNNRGFDPGTQIKILLTTDSGNSWIDISENMEKSIMNSKPTSEFLSKALMLEGQRIFVLSNHGNIYSSQDQGRSWSLSAKMVNEQKQSNFWEFGQREDGGFWLGGSAKSTEGSWGVVAQTTSTYGLNKFRLKGYSFSDVKALDYKEFAVIANANDQDVTKERSSILFTSDLGETWSIISSSEKADAFSEIVVLNSSKFLVLESDMQAIIFERKSL